jgi:hypothetical protein
MPYNQLTNLDYFEIRNSLRDYLRANSDFTDYDFEGSVFSNLLDLLAYNTYYTAFNTNMVANEMFLDSATLRDNVISIAKQLGYTPRSATAPEADINCTIDVSSAGTLNSLVFKRGSGFITTIDNGLYQYILQDDAKAAVNGNQAIFENLKIYEGTLIKQYLTVGSNAPEVILDNVGIDVSTIRVNVYDSSTSTTFNIYTLSENILTLSPASQVFFVTEVEDENYKVSFGDGTLGKNLTPGQYVEVTYMVTAGEVTNSARVFTFNGVVEDENGVIFGINDVAVTVNSASYGGASIETVDSIKRNAPSLFGTQNRAVTSADYEAICRRIYPSIADVYSFGGEESIPPEYGKVKIVIKPSNAAFLTSFTKRQIQNEIKKFSVGSITPEIIDSSILYIELKSKIYFQSSLTNKKPDAIRSAIIKNVESYLKNSDTEKFGGKFRYSRLVSAIDSTDKSVRSNLTEIIMRKDFYPSLNNKAYYELCFNNPFDYDNDELALTSTGFVVQEYPNFTSYIEDRDGKIVLYRLDSQTGTKIILNSNIGNINYVTGEIQMFDVTIIKGSFDDNRIEVRLRPQFNDIIAIREMFLDVDIAQSTFTIIQE